MKQAASDAETEEAIQASLSAALVDLDNLELLAPESVAPKRLLAVLPRIPRGMPPLPHGRLIPPLPVSRLSLVPRLIESLRPKAAFEKFPEPEPVVRAATVVVAARAPRWPGVVLVLLVIGLLGAALRWLQLP